MRILVDHGGYEVKNVGDLAMLQVAIARLQSLFPDARIHTFTTAPELLREHVQNVHFVSNLGRNMWFSDLLHHIYAILPKSWITAKWFKFEDYLRNEFPTLAHSFIRIKLRKDPNLEKDVRTFLELMLNADLIVVAGGGFITDEFEGYTTSILKMIGFAQKLGKPTVMFGQGLGPLRNQKLASMARNTLPVAKLIALREQCTGPSLLKSLGVSQERIFITGDDAIELAYSSRKPKLGDGIGLNLRVAAYSGINATSLEVIKSALHRFADQEQAPLLPIPIAHGFLKGYMETDSASIRQLLTGYDDASDGGETLDTPLKVIGQVGRCRVVITGSYHAGVFALSQGIPVICLAKSQYYVDKFYGLADQFGVGCEVLLLDDKDIGEKLLTSAQIAWRSAEQIRPQLLDAAQKQIEFGHAAYQRIYDIVKG